MVHDHPTPARPYALISPILPYGQSRGTGDWAPGTGRRGLGRGWVQKQGGGGAPAQGGGGGGGGVSLG